MHTFLLFLLGYLAYAIIWGLICLVAYSLSVSTGKSSFMYFIAGLGVTAGYIFNFLIGIGFLLYLINLLFQGHILLLLVMIFIGGSLFAALLSFLQMPFMLIPAYFSQLLDKDEMNSNLEKGREINVLDKKLATFFLAVYGLNIFSVFANQGYEGYRWGDFIINPFLWVISQLLLFGLFKGIYNKIKHKPFFYPRKKIFLLSILKFTFWLLIILTGLYFIFGIW